MSAFKFDSASCFLTYPQSTLSHDEIVQHLRTLADIIWARVCTESHATEGTHQHVVCKFAKRVQSRNQRVFDVNGRHPNIQRVRSIKHALEYVSKDGEFTDYGTVPAGCGEDFDWMAHASTCTEAEFYELALKKRLPFMYAKKFWELGHKQTNEIGESYEPDLTRECIELNLHIPAESQATVVVGPSGCGKSSWAKRVCKKPSLWVRHMDMLRAFRPGYHQSIIFDDMAFAHIPREAQIHLVDFHDEAHIHCRYGVAIIPSETQKIFTANYYPFTEDPAIDRRVYKINLY